MAPQAPLVGKKLLGKRVKLSVTVDEVLNQLVMDAAKELSQTYGQIIDNALWTYLNSLFYDFKRIWRNKKELRSGCCFCSKLTDFSDYSGVFLLLSLANLEEAPTFFSELMELQNIFVVRISNSKVF